MKIFLAFCVHINDRNMNAVLCKSPDSHGTAAHGWQAEVEVVDVGKQGQKVLKYSRMMILNLKKEKHYAW